jgi:hypothetical protein
MNTSTDKAIRNLIDIYGASLGGVGHILNADGTLSRPYEILVVAQHAVREDNVAAAELLLMAYGEFVPAQVAEMETAIAIEQDEVVFAQIMIEAFDHVLSPIPGLMLNEVVQDNDTQDDLKSYDTSFLPN